MPPAQLLTGRTGGIPRFPPSSGARGASAFAEVFLDFLHSLRSVPSDLSELFVELFLLGEAGSASTRCGPVPRREQRLGPGAGSSEAALLAQGQQTDDGALPLGSAVYRGAGFDAGDQGLRYPGRVGDLVLGEVGAATGRPDQPGRVSLPYGLGEFGALPERLFRADVRPGLVQLGDV